VIPLVGVNVLGLAGFAWPLLLGVGSQPGETHAHATDAPIMLALLVPLLVLVAIDEARDRRGDARLVALLGVLVAINSFARIPQGPTGEGLVFVLPILAGWWIGGRFAFLLGAFTMLTSAVLTGGIGPWLPFQMFALGWVGAGAAVVRRAFTGRYPRIALGVYAYASSLAYGFLMTLWFWPFLGTGNGPLYEAGLGLGATLGRYERFYLLTSLPWDAARATLTNVPLVVILARPVGVLFERVKLRFSPVIEAA
jgi:energy-coupling factor transport system substrate-specific component